MRRDVRVQQGMHGLLDGHGRGQGLEAKGAHVVGHGDSLDDDAHAEVGVEPRVDPAAGEGLGLVQHDGAAGVDAADDAPAEVDRAQDVAFDAGHAAGAGVDPKAASEAGEQVGGHVGRMESRVGAEVEHDLRRGDVGKLRLAGRVGADHGVRHELDELQGVVAGGVAAAMVADEVGRGVEDGLQADELGGVFGGGDGKTVAFDEAGYGAVLAFDDITDDVALGVDLVHAVAQRGIAAVGDDLQLVVGGGLDPGQRGSGRCRRLEGGPGLLSARAEDAEACGQAESEEPKAWRVTDARGVGFWAVKQNDGKPTSEDQADGDLSPTLDARNGTEDDCAGAVRFSIVWLIPAMTLGERVGPGKGMNE
jgi:hypothetical protein